MARTIRPRALELLKNEPNAAADAAIAEALPHVEASLKEPLFCMLLRRGHTPGLARILGQFHHADEQTKQLLLDHVKDLSEAVRVAIDSTRFTDRAGAIEFIVQSNEGCLLDSLTDALRSRCPRTCELAATTLNIITAHLLTQMESKSDDDEAAALLEQENYLAEALKRAIRIWDQHLQTKALEAAMWLSHRLAGAFQRKLQDPRSTIAAAIKNILLETIDPRMAGFTLHALSMSNIRATAAKTIGETQDLSFIRALVRHGDLLVNKEIRQGFRWIRHCRWLHHSLDDLLKLGPEDAIRAVRLLAAIGGPSRKKTPILRELMAMDDQVWPRAVFEYLKADTSREANELLTLLAVRCRNQTAESASRELRRRYGAAGVISTGAGSESRYADQRTPRQVDPFDRYFDHFERLTAEEQSSLIETMKQSAGGSPMKLRARLSTGQPLDRIRALQLAHKLGLVRQLSEQIYRLTHDPDPLIRSQAVALLVELPDNTTRRILRTAVVDPDDRVQANAVEVLDQLQDPDRERNIESMLDSHDHRVRANAVKSLLRLGRRKAGDALIHMLEHPSRSHRLSGLWVIENLKIDSMSHRLEHMVHNDPDMRIRQRAQSIKEQLTDTYETPLFTDDDGSTDELLYTAENLS